MDEQSIPRVEDNTSEQAAVNNNNFELEVKKPNEIQENFNHKNEITNMTVNQFDEIPISSNSSRLEQHNQDTHMETNIRIESTNMFSEEHNHMRLEEESRQNPPENNIDNKGINQSPNHVNGNFKPIDSNSIEQLHAMEILESVENSSLSNETTTNNLTLVPNEQPIKSNHSEKQANQSPGLDQNSVQAESNHSDSHESSHVLNCNSQMSNLDNSIMAVSSEQHQLAANEEITDAVAANEESSSAKTVNASSSMNGASSPSKSPKKKARTPSVNKSLNNGHGLNNSNDTSPSSNQKRRKKDPNAPKAPLNGYLVYFNEERADMRLKNPLMSFGDLTKIIATKWKELSNGDKQRYTNEAEADKERYNREMAEYKKTDTYKQYLNENLTVKDISTNKNNNINNNSHQNDASVLASQDGEPNLNWLQQETNIAGFDIPIFTEEFIEHSKARELEMRQLRKEITEMENQNKVLNNHVDNLKESTNKIDSDIERLKESSIQMEKNADLFRQTILHCFNNVPLPNTQEYPTPNNIDDYIMRIYSILNATIQSDQSSTEPAFTVNRQFADHVKSVFSKINFSPLFDSI